MAFFPQLSTGALAHYPVAKRVIRRTIGNTLPDGSTVKLADSGVAMVEWDLQFSSLTDREAFELEKLFLECEGGLKTFSFLDPAGNLLAWSEDFDEDAWVKDPLISLEGGLADPFGGAAAFLFRNSAAAAQSMRQIVDAPARYLYCLSAWVKGAQSNLAVMRIGGEFRQFQTAPGWTRVSMAARPGGEDETVVFGLEVPPGQALEIFGLQAEAQPAASGYRRTGANGGVYASAKFGAPELIITAEGPNSHACRLKVVSHANGL